MLEGLHRNLNFLGDSAGTLLPQPIPNSMASNCTPWLQEAGTRSRIPGYRSGEEINGISGRPSGAAFDIHVDSEKRPLYERSAKAHDPGELLGAWPPLMLELHHALEISARGIKKSTAASQRCARVSMTTDFG